MEYVSEWRELPQDILLLILKSLNAQFYHLLLRAVCPSWRSALPLNSTTSDSRHYCHNPGVPLKIPYLKSQNINPTVEQELPLYGNIVETIFFHVSPVEKDPNSASWIIQAEEVGPGKWALFNPLYGNKLTLTPEMVDVSMNLLDYRITELGRSHSLRWVYEIDSRPFTRQDVSKLVCSFNESNSLVLIMALCNSGKLAFYKPGSEEWSFSDVIWGDVFFRFFDIISYNGIFYALDAVLRLLKIDPFNYLDLLQVPDLLCTNIEPAQLVHINYSESYLVESRGSLYLILVCEQFHSCLTAEYSFEDDGINEAKWVEVTSVDDQVLFAGGESSFACSSVVLQCDNNICIFFRKFVRTSGNNGCYYDEFQNFHAHRDTPIEPCSLNCKSLNRIFWPLPSRALLDMDSDVMLIDRLTTCFSSCNHVSGILSLLVK